MTEVCEVSAGSWVRFYRSDGSGAQVLVISEVEYLVRGNDGEVYACTTLGVVPVSHVLETRDRPEDADDGPAEN